MMNLRTLFFIMAMVISQLSFAQGFTVKEFKQNLNDGSAFHAPMDAEGHPCGLIKVRTDNSELHFKGDIVGDVENKMNEYWVYVAQGCGFLNVFHPNLLPLVVPFSDYGIDISSKATYILTLEETKYKKEKTGLMIVVKPEDADLYIDDIFIDKFSGNGLYQLYLPKGEHVCKLSKTGYRPNVQVVQTGKASQNISVELESVMAELEIKCKAATAEIYVDGELKGNGTWKGEILAGEHQIEARQQSYESNTQTISIAEKESRLLIIPELKRSMGKLEIVTNPDHIPVIVDGKNVGVSPCTLDVETGNHYVVCKAFGLVPTRSEIIVNNDHVANLRIDLQYSEERDWLIDTYRSAYQGDENAISELAETYVWWGSHDNEVFYKEAVYWYERYSLPEKLISSSDCWINAFCYVGKPEKALEIYQKVKEEQGELFSSELYMSFIGDAFLKKKEYDKAIGYLENADEHGYEGLGDCYVAKGDKQRAATFYKRCLSLDYYDGKNRVEKKLKELGY